MPARYLLCAIALCILAAPASGQSVAGPYASTFEQEAGIHLVLVYVGSQDCGPCHDPELKAAVERAKVLLQERAAAEGKQFSTIGVVKNYDWEEGLDFLRETGYFDEVVAGRSWFNTAVAEHCWERAACTPAMPMIIIYEQAVEAGERGYTFGARRYLATVKGADGIPSWVEGGATLPLP